MVVCRDTNRKEPPLSTTSGNIERGPERPIYRQIADRLRADIAGGFYAPGERLPSMARLARQMDVSHQTVANAVKVLRGEALIDTRGTSGVWVASERGHSESAQQLAASIDGASESSQVQILSAEVVTCPAYVGDLLDINAETGAALVSRREAVARRRGKPYRLSVSWAAPWAYGAAPELLEARLINGLRAIARGSGVSATQERWFFEARTADEREARHLGLQVGDTVLAQASVWCSDDGHPVEYREAVTGPGEVISGTSPVDLS